MIPSTQYVFAWHFVGAALRDGRAVPPDGEWLVHEGDVQMRIAGLHASRELLDALNYAPGPTICRVVVADVVVDEGDKLVARRRAILWRVGSDDLLRKFARQAALSVIHLWDAPEVVRHYLETGDDSLRAAARDAAKNAAGSAAWAAAWAATGDAAWAAARAATWAAWAAGDAAWAAARDAGWAAARDSLNTQLEQMVREAAGQPDDGAIAKALPPMTQ